MKRWKRRIISLALSSIVLGGFVFTAGCKDGALGKKGKLSGTALAEALLATERINHEHLQNSFDFMEDRLAENTVVATGGEIYRDTQVNAYTGGTSLAKPLTQSTQSRGTKGEIISGEGDTAVYSWSEFEQLVVELHYFQSHFSAGQSRTQRVDDNIAFLEKHTDIKNKWVKGVSYVDYAMQVNATSEIIYEDDTYNENYSVGIRTVNDEVNTTYEYYENQDTQWIRTLATPNRRYEYSTVHGMK